MLFAETSGRRPTLARPAVPAMFSETRYALNGDLRVAYRTSREGHRDLVFVSHSFTNCEVFPELPSLHGWAEAMTSLGRLIFFDPPGAGASDRVTPTLEQWADSIIAVLDDLGSREAVLLAVASGFAPAALFAATHPSGTTALVVLEFEERGAHELKGVRRRVAAFRRRFYIAVVFGETPSAPGGTDYAKDISASETEASLAPGFYVATVAIPHGVRA
jgi:pimeloyl-ACP methyl ester carboxylesterase